MDYKNRYASLNMHAICSINQHHGYVLNLSKLQKILQNIYQLVEKKMSSCIEIKLTEK